jgi:hypothetical protein
VQIGLTALLIIEAAARIKGTAILDAEVVWIGPDGVAEFDARIAVLLGKAKSLSRRFADQP